MNYQIVIDYTNNLSKAGKLTLVDQNNNIVLSKVAVAIPVTQVNLNGRTELNLTTEQVVKNPSLVTLDTNRSSSLDDRIDRMVNKGRKNLIMVNNSTPIFVAQESDSTKMQVDKNSFVLHKEDFKVLFNILNEKENVAAFRAKKVSFLWFPEKVDSIPTDVTRDYQTFKNKEQNLLLELETEKSNKLKQESEKRKPNVTQTVQPKVVNVNEPVKNINVVKQVKPLMPTKKVHVQQRTQLDDDIDPFDVMFMYSHPNLAPIYKPNSMLAWYMYFNDDDRDVNKTTIQQSVNDIPGFENVGSTDVRYTPSGYSITLYEDEQKTKPLGVVNHNDQDKCYEITSPTGEKTTLQVGNDGVVSGCVIGTDKKSTNFNFIENGAGFSGNWDSSPTEGINITSGMSLNSDYEVTSTLNKSFDLSSVTKEREEELSKTYSKDNTEDWTPPPPPPPPPSDTMQWSSTSDPYSLW